MFVVTYRKLFFALSAVLMVASIVSMIVYGFDMGIDFKGGSITSGSYGSGRPPQQELKAAIDTLGLGNYVLQPTGEKAYSLRTRELTNEEKERVFDTLNLNNTYPVTIDQYNSIGPVVGNELKNKALTAIVIVVLCIVIFITYAFRHVSEPVASWKYGFATIISLIHDVVIPTGFFVAYSHYYGGEIDILFISALLAILGYSVHDTIVVFDRVREHLRINKEQRITESFEKTVGKSVSETFGRSINTSVTIFIALLALYLVGGETTRDFAVVLLAGVVAGTYSSIFVASPLLVTLEKLQKKA